MGRRPISIAERRQRQRFGELLQYWRGKLRLGLREAAREAGIHHTRLSRIESGELPAGIEDLPGLEHAYKVSAEVLELARSSQMPSSLFRDRLRSLKSGGGKTETFPVRITPQEKRELTLFLGYLRLTKRT